MARPAKLFDCRGRRRDDGRVKWVPSFQCLSCSFNITTARRWLLRHDQSGIKPTLVAVQRKFASAVDVRLAFFHTGAGDERVDAGKTNAAERRGIFKSIHKSVPPRGRRECHYGQFTIGRRKSPPQHGLCARTCAPHGRVFELRNIILKVCTSLEHGNKSASNNRARSIHAGL